MGTDELKPGVYNQEIWAKSPRLIAAKPAYEEMHRTAEKYKEWLEILVDNSFEANFFGVMSDIAAKKNPASIRDNLAMAVVPTLEKLKAAGAPDDLLIARERLKENGKTFTLGQIRAMIPQFQTGQKEVVAHINAEYEARWKPFLSLLKGDRLALFNKYQVGVLYGVGGKLLDTPQKFLATPIMAKVTIDQSGVVSRWNMTIWRFRGDKIIATQTKSGWGNDAPSAAYR